MAPGQRKLRDSCDSCHIAKVKCIKTETGECLRCTSSGSTCSFSPSDRRGKPRGAKNKCNRVPQPQANAPKALPVTAAPASAATAGAAAVTGVRASPVPPRSQLSAQPDEAYPSPGYEFEKYFNNTGQADFVTADATWTLAAPEDAHPAFEMSASNDSLASMVHSDWMHLDGGMMHSASPPLQQHTPRTSVSSAYAEATLASPQPFPLHAPSLHETGVFEVLPSPTAGPSACKCYPINLQSLYALHCQQITSSSPSGNATSLDVALFINNKAIDRCHSMLSCTECVLNPDKEKSSTNMLMLAGAMDDILMSYSNACTAYLDASSQDPLVFSSGSSVAASSSSSTPPHMDDADFAARTHSTSSASSCSSAGNGRTLFSPATPLSLGTYRVEGEDGYHLKLEILKIELRKVERLWMAFRDTCALQKFEDEQRNLYAALVCYLAKKLQRTASMLEARRRHSTSGW